MKITNIHKIKFEMIAILFLSYLSFWLIYKLNITNDDYLIFIQGDYLMHSSTYFGFLYDEWNFPLFSSDKFFFNKELNLLWADNNPLYSLILKVFFSLTNIAIPNPATYWLLISYLFMGIFSYKLLNELGIDSYIYKYIGSLIFLSLPLLPTIASEHYTLQSHWLIVASFYYYLKAQNNKKYLIQLGFLSGIGLMIQIYFFPMIIMVYFISLFPLTFGTSLKYYIQSILIISFKLFIYLFVFWDGTKLFSNNYITNSQSNFTPMWSAETNSFFCSQSSFEFINKYLLCYYPYTNNNIEAYAYLGIGIIFGLIFILFRLKVLFPFFKKYSLLIFGAILLLLLSFGNKFKLFHKQIFEFELLGLQSIFYEYFRAHGRFSYVFYYLVVIMVIFGIYKIFNNRNIAIIILFMVLNLQLYDLNHIINNSNLNDFNLQTSEVSQYKDYLESYENISSSLKLNQENRLFIYPHDNCENDYDKLHLGLQFLKFNGSLSSFRYRGGLNDEICSGIDLTYILENLNPIHLAVDKEYIELFKNNYECSEIKFLYSKDFLYCSK